LENLFKPYKNIFSQKINKHTNLQTNSIMDRKEYLGRQLKGDKEIDEEKWIAPRNKQNKLMKRSRQLHGAKNKNDRIFF
jgi:hypothetical protein